MYPKWDDVEAVSLFQNGLNESQAGDIKSIELIVRVLKHLPLAIKQASSYIAMKLSISNTVSRAKEACSSCSARNSRIRIVTTMRATQ